ncbi:MAG TPA: GWxTD domain-containing protein [Phaeodactylibacter sp.]|nr:GWxTD domain-containing protein [Phaeodactylibacter sp.]
MKASFNKSVMKKFSLLLILLASFGRALYALEADVSYATYTDLQKSYVEVYLKIMGNTVLFDTVGGGLQAGVEVVLIFRKDSAIFMADKYALYSPISEGPVHFMDMKRYVLPNGEYELEVRISDLAQTENSLQRRIQLPIHYEQDKPAMSDIRLLTGIKPAQGEGPFVRNGYFMEPLAFNFCDKKAERLFFYLELYNMDRLFSDFFKLRLLIKDAYSGKEMLVSHKTKRPQKIVQLMHLMDVRQLPSGNYFFQVSVLDSLGNPILAKQLFFQRSNPYLFEQTTDSSDLVQSFVMALDSATLSYSLRAMVPVVPPDQVEVINGLVHKGQTKDQRAFLFSYWAAKNPNQPGKAYEDFMKVARAVDATFKSGFGYGFETDRGYIYLKYGPPNDIFHEENEPSAPPYEIWSYNEFPRTNQRNVKFLFYNPSLAPGDFRLLHSTARGELNNPNWERILYQAAPNEFDGENAFDATRMKDNFARQARKRMEDF